MQSKHFRLPDWCSKPIDSRMLGLYRIAYGLFMVYTILNYFSIDLIHKMFVEPKINFGYDYLKWVKPLPEFVMNLLLGLLLLCAIAICIGFFFKWSCRIFALGYAYIFLIDKSIYNNHIYLFILLALLLSMTDADCCYSLKRKSNKPIMIPRWQILILQLQIVIVYFYGGLAKLTRDWMVDCQPVRTLVDQFSGGRVLSDVLKSEAAIFIINYGGLIVDFGAPLFLWYKPFRRWAIFLFIGFNVLNSRIFSDIGIFPYVMLASLFLFYEVSEIPWLNKILGGSNKYFANSRSKEMKVKSYKRQDLSYIKLYALGVYIVFQLIFPLRGHLLPNDLDWTTIGNRFSWRMKVDTRKPTQLQFFVNSPEFTNPVQVDVQTFINDMQIKNISMDPRSVVDFANFLRIEAVKYETKDPSITANIKVEYNGRPEQYFVQPGIDLSRINYSPFKKADWVVPLN